MNLRLQLGASDFIQIMPACSHAKALECARQLTVRLDVVFKAAMTKKTFTKDQLKDIARQVFLEQVDESWASLENCRPGQAESTLKMMLEGARIQANTRELFSDGAILVEPKLAELGIQSDDYEPDDWKAAYRYLCKLGVRANAAAWEVSSSRYYKAADTDPADVMFRGLLGGEGEREWETGFVGTNTERQATEAQERTILLSEAIVRYVDYKVSSKKWQVEAEEEARGSLKVFQELFGDVPIVSINKKDFATFVDCLRKLPAARGKSKKMRETPVRQLIARVEAGELKAISEGTVEKHFNNVAALFKWAVRRGELETNQSLDVYDAPKKTQKESEKRAAWTAEEIGILLSCPIFRGRKNRSWRFTPGLLFLRDDWYWMTLLLCFHPVRPEEVGQLRLSDFTTKNGVWGFQIDGGVTVDDVDAMGKRIKTLTSKRYMPVHSILLELGFREHFESLLKAKKQNLFPTFKPQGKPKRYSHAYCKTLSSKAKSALGLKEVSTYGLRHSAITALAASCNNDTLRKRLQGHKLSGEDARYIKEPDPKLAQEAINGIRYEGIDAAFIREDRKDSEP
ncbi:hypothetical protein [Pseudovibrio ascidiaceicola]|uniref:hypothetical protein n=1 Tax=Pseudovibrio ascidiaceicola TaxID=285279 RepID=UPI000D68EA98|nr:hypothetical protein [Pseudovibrio ascidiaceicola]